MDKKKNVIMIATYPIFSTGINIKTLKNLIFASPLKSKIKVLQSIGRTLRKHISKEHAIIYDICDNCKYLKSHAKARQKYYDKESFEVIESNITEGDSF
jgi:type I site-specific restriction endonuclease